MGKAIQVGVWICAIFVGLYFGSNMLMFGHLIPLARVDHLNKPAEVRSWNEDGLILEDGRHVMPTGMRKLPLQSNILKTVTRRGIEIAKDGRVFGLVDLWHWCGNDAVKYDLRKIDVAQLLAYYREGKSDIEPPEYADTPFKGRDHDWNISGYTRMKVVFNPKLIRPLEKPR